MNKEITELENIDIDRDEAEKDNATEKTVTEAAEVTENDAPERVVVFEEALEAILFAAGHPITYATLARVFDTTPAKIKEKVIEYALKYNMPEIPRGVILLTYGDSCQLCTKKYYLTEIREALGIKKSGTLSTSSLEALAIVAYNQPVTRVFVDTLRRADSSYAMNNLLDRGLIEVKGRLDVPGRPMLYGTTSDFLRAFGLKDISALPTTTEEIQAMFSKAKTVENTAEDGEDSSQIAIELPEEESSQLSMDISVDEIDREAEATALSPELIDSIADAYEEPSAEDDVILDEL